MVDRPTKSIVSFFLSSNPFRLLLLLSLTIFCAFFTSADEAIRRMSITNRFMQRRMDMDLDIMDDQQLMLQKGHGTNKENCGNDQYFDQILDHTKEDNFYTYKQRFQVNMEFFNASDSQSQQSPAVFLMIGGTDEIRKFWICNERTGIAQMAKEHGAILVQLEHRFFGGNASAELGDFGYMVRWLNMDQALADIASFIPHFNRLHGLKNARWVAFGGSYAGSLAAWFRVKYPHLTVGAVASSAPIWPKVDFWEYVYTMEYAILRAEPYCYARVKNAFEQLVDMLHSDKGKADLDALYEATPKFSEMKPIDLTNFLSTIFGAWQDIVQNTYAYDRSLRETHNLTKACEMMKPDVRPGNGTPEQQGLYNVFWHVKKSECDQLGIPEAECKKNNFKFEDTIKPLKDVEGDYQYATTIARIWMSCNEFGWFQTTDNEGSIFGDILSMNFYYTICHEVIGTSVFYVEPQVAKLFAKLGNGCTFEATNLISANGRWDPWSPLSIRSVEECREFDQKMDYAKEYKHEQNHLVTVWTKGAAHCADMYPPYEGEPEGLKLTREKIRAEVKYYLEASAANAIITTRIFMLLLPLMAFLATILLLGYFL